MKNYTLNEIDSENFILNYKIVDDEIIINFASKKHKDKCVIPYTIENEKEILKKMKQQVVESSNFSRTQKRIEMEAPTILSYGLFAFISISALNAVALFFGLTQATIFLLPYNLIFLLISSYGLYELVSSKVKLSDVRKNRLFLENEELLNKNLGKRLEYHKNMSLGIKTKKNEMCKHIDLDLNKIDKIKYKRLKSVLENIKHDIEVYETAKKFPPHGGSSIQCEDKVLVKKK